MIAYDLYLSQMQLDAKKFQKIHVEISNICNLQCSFCPPVERSKKIMDENLFAKIIRGNKHLTEEFCFHVMGEPLGHPQFPRFVEICEQEEVKIFLVTNGTLLNDTNQRAMLSPAIKQINFSLQSFSSNFPGKDPSAYLNKIFSFTKIAFEKFPQMYINYRLWNLLESDAGLAKNEIYLKKIETAFGVSINRIVDVRKEKSKHVINKLFLHFDTEFIWPSEKFPQRSTKGYCHALKTHVAIHANGDVVPCCLDKEAAINLGSAQNMSLADILTSPRATKMREGFQQRNLVENLCQKCSYIQRFD